MCGVQDDVECFDKGVDTKGRPYCSSIVAGIDLIPSLALDTVLIPLDLLGAVFQRPDEIDCHGVFFKIF
ncbi:MAG: hypothetical protein K1X83_15430 [Oligoflexia bacterium]|nr:hypothetical protein [Oligoflexia bacterium]